MKERSHRGLTAVEVLAGIVIVVILLACVLPALARTRGDSGLQASLSNLMALGFAHAVYAADYDGRQMTMVVDGLASYGSAPQEALLNYRAEHPEGHPDIIAGWGPDGGGQGAFIYRYNLDGTFPGHAWACMPLYFYGSQSSAVYGFGQFRFANAQPFHTYVEGRWYGRTFYGPNDTVAYDCVEEGFEWPYSFLPGSILTCARSQAWSSYASSPAAMFHPDVLSFNDDTGEYYTDPFSIDHGLNVPGLYQARHPDLKTQFIEHHWNQNEPPDPCNPAFEEGTYDGCEPYYFNHAFASEPATLFYDMSVRLLPNTEAFAADDKLMSQSGHGTWSRDTPLGDFGYFGDLSYDGLVLSHHVLTVDGILGRDTLHGLSPGPLPPQRPAAVRSAGVRSTGRPYAPGATRQAELLPDLD